MHREELGTGYYMDHNYPAQVLPITNYSPGKWKQQQGKGRKAIYQTHKRPGVGEDSILVKRQVFYFFIIF